jgi:outer membrane receptor protein involved in Fe transport
MDLTIGALLARRITATGSYSWVSENLFPGIAGPADIALNGPRNKGSIAIAYDDERPATGGEIRVRAVQAFPVRSGVYAGTVRSYGVVDLILQWTPRPLRTVTLSLALYNLLDERHREFVGAPEVGRLVVGRARTTF